MKHIKTCLKILSLAMVGLICLFTFQLDAFASAQPSISFTTEICDAKTNVIVRIVVANPNKKEVSGIGINVTFTTNNASVMKTKTKAICYPVNTNIKETFNLSKDVGVFIAPNTSYNIETFVRIDGKKYTSKNSFTSASLSQQINSNEVFLKQESSNTCTLAASTMMLRRKAIILKQVGWKDITESNVKKVAWGNGLAFEFSYSDIKVKTVGFETQVKNILGENASFESKKMKKIQIVNELLRKHPEGIVIYEHSKPHAVLLTDYDSNADVYYASDSGQQSTKGRVALTDTTLNIGGNMTQEDIIGSIEQYWFCP